MGKKYILGNWKMNGSRPQAQSLAAAIAAFAAPQNVVIALFPPSPLLPVVEYALKKSQIALGAQDVSPEADGAFTGDVSAGMLKETGCSYVIVGHSERRTLHKESDAEVKAKATAALKSGLIPVICVGESQEEREAGHYLKVIESQLKGSLPEAPGAIIHGV